MTWVEIKAWLLANGWSLHRAHEGNVTPAYAAFRDDCAAGKVVSRTIANGATIIVHNVDSQHPGD